MNVSDMAILWLFTVVATVFCFRLAQETYWAWREATEPDWTKNWDLEDYLSKLNELMKKPPIFDPPKMLIWQDSDTGVWWPDDFGEEE